LMAYSPLDAGSTNLDHRIDSRLKKIEEIH
jgi:hypothetical protein